jgi:hypothetical protein
MRKLIVGVLVSLFCFSCETIVDELDLSKFPALREKLVLTAFISPQDEVLKVRLNKSIPLYGDISGKYVKIFDSTVGDSVLYYEADNYIKNAVVVLSSDEGSITLVYDENQKSYVADAKKFRIKNGKKYKIQTEWNGQTVSAETTIPEDNVPIYNLAISTYDEISRDFFGTDTSVGYRVNFSFKDVPKKQNYYKIWGELEYPVLFPVLKPDSVLFQPRTVYSYLRWPDSQSVNNDRYRSDKDLDGQEFNSINGEIEQRRQRVCPGGNSFEDKGCFRAKLLSTGSHTLTLELWNMARELYEYHISLGKFNQSSNNPFSEPSPVYTNVKNGLGIFAGYSRYIQKNKVKI